MNLCRSCGQDFGSVSAFDAHRVGKHEYLYDSEHPDGRRCLSVVEMQSVVCDDGSKRFAQNGLGRWSLRAGLERARNRSLATPQAPGGIA